MTRYRKINAESLLSQRLLIIAPHMDDEILGCGGSILLHKDKSQIHCVYATDGSRSPAPLLPWTGSIDSNIVEIRRREALQVMQEVGIPQDNLVFLNFPDGALSRNIREFRARLGHEITRIDPSIVLAPFRYDLHSDHVAANRCTRVILSREERDRPLLEYIVYYRWRLISSGDVRSMIPESRILTVNTESVAARKSSAIYRYRSQTETPSAWQDQPVLTAKNIADRCGEDESFLISNPNEPLSRVFRKNRYKVVTAHFLQRVGKRRKDQLVAFFKWLLQFGEKNDA